MSEIARHTTTETYCFTGAPIAILYQNSLNSQDIFIALHTSAKLDLFK